MTDGMDTKGMMAEFIGSLSVTLLVWADLGAGHGSAATAGAACVVLAIMWMTFSGSEILPILTIGNMAAGRTEWQTGALNFSMQVLGGLIAAGILFWQAESADGSVLGIFPALYAATQSLLFFIPNSFANFLATIFASLIER